MGRLYINANGHFKTSLVQNLPPENGFVCTWNGPPDETHIHNRGSARFSVRFDTEVKGNTEMAYYVTTKSLKLSINYNNQNLGRVRSFSLITLRSRSCLFVLKNYVTMTVKWSQIIVNLSSKLWTMMKFIDLVCFIFYSILSDGCRFQCNRFTMFSYCRLYWLPISVDV